ncbi:NAD dependent epimerase/dehydratase, partial [Arthrobacter sp. Hiyo6]
PAAYARWKLRSERLVRASGNPYTIVRPGWFDYNQPDQRTIVMLQGDRRQSGSPADGVIARDQIARVLIDSLAVMPPTTKLSNSSPSTAANRPTSPHSSTP